MDATQLSALNERWEAFAQALMSGGDAEAIARQFTDPVDTCRCMGIKGAYENDFEGAIAWLSKPECADDAFSQRLLALATLRTRGAEEARLALNRALENGLGMSMFLDIFADLMGAAGYTDKQAAAHAYAAAVDGDALTLAETLLSMRDIEGAQAALDELPQDVRESVRGVVYEIYVLIQKGDTAGARRLLSEKSEVLEEDGLAHFMLDIVLRFAEGEDIIAETEEVKEAFAVFRIPGLLKVGEFEKAEQEAKDFIADQPSLGESIQVINELIRFGRYAAAQEALNLMGMPEDALSDQAIMMSYAQARISASTKGARAAQAEYLKLIDNCRSAYIQDPARTHLIIMRAGCLRDIGRLDEAMELALFLRKVSPEREDVGNLIKTIEDMRK